MGKKIETTIAENISVDENIELCSNYSFPFAGKDFILTKKAYKEAVKLQKEHRLILINIVNEIDGIFKFKYSPDVSEFRGKRPDTFNKYGTFTLKVRGLILDCYIDIFRKNSECIIFGVRCDKKIITTVEGSNGIDFYIDMSN